MCSTAALGCALVGIELPPSLNPTEPFALEQNLIRAPSKFTGTRLQDDCEEYRATRALGDMECFRKSRPLLDYTAYISTYFFYAPLPSGAINLSTMSPV